MSSLNAEAGLFATLTSSAPGLGSRFGPARQLSVLLGHAAGGIARRQPREFEPRFGEALRLSGLQPPLAKITLAQTLRIAGRKAMTIAATNPDPASTIQASAGLIQNRKGSKVSKVKQSRKVLINLPVRKSRILKIYDSRCVISPVGVRSK